MKPIELLVLGTSGIDAITSFQASSLHQRLWQMTCTDLICFPHHVPPPAVHPTFLLGLIFSSAV